MAAAQQTPTYENWRQVDPTKPRIHIFGQGDWEHNDELRTEFSKLFGAPVKAVYTHAIGSNAEVIAGTGLKLYCETVFVFRLDGTIIRFYTNLDATIASSADISF